MVPNDPAATSWSATGAIIAAARTNPAAAREALAQAPFAVAMSALATVVGAGPQSWNDELERAQNDVLAALAAALKLVLGKDTGVARGAPQPAKTASGTARAAASAATTIAAPARRMGHLPP